MVLYCTYILSVFSVGDHQPPSWLYSRYVHTIIILYCILLFNCHFCVLFCLCSCLSLYRAYGKEGMELHVHYNYMLELLLIIYVSGNITIYSRRYLLQYMYMYGFILAITHILLTTPLYHWSHPYTLPRPVLKRFHDVDHYISLLIQVPKNETVKTAENKITLLIYLKHCLELVAPLKQTISMSENPLLKTFNEVRSCNEIIVTQFNYLICVL